MIVTITVFDKSQFTVAVSTYLGLQSRWVIHIESCVTHKYGNINKQRQPSQSTFQMDWIYFVRFFIFENLRLSNDNISRKLYCWSALQLSARTRSNLCLWTSFSLILYNIIFSSLLLFTEPFAEHSAIRHNFWPKLRYSAIRLNPGSAHP